MPIEFRRLQRGDEHMLANVANQVFDDPISSESTAEFLADPRHFLVVALDDDRVIGFVSAVIYVHPDKTQPELWINEVGVAPTHHRRGVARGLLSMMLDIARDAGCAEAWVLTDQANEAAMRLYASLDPSESSDAVMFTFSLDTEAH